MAAIFEAKPGVPLIILHEPGERPGLWLDEHTLPAVIQYVRPEIILAHSIISANLNEKHIMM